jgi:hypothetical protein
VHKDHLLLTVDKADAHYPLVATQNLNATMLMFPCLMDSFCPQVRKDHLLLTVDKADSDLMQRALAQAPAAALVTWRLDQSVRDTTARQALLLACLQC